MDRPTVSVCLPTRNRAPLLGHALRSVLAQTLDDLEVIVSDNASQDDTARVVQGVRDHRVRYLRNAQDIGARENWNRAFSLTRGQYIAPLSDDDLMLPDNLARKVAVLAAHPAVGLVHSKYHVIDDAGRIVRADTNWGHGPDRACDAVEPGAEVVQRMLLSYNRPTLPTVVFRRACYERLGGFSRRLSLTVDWEYWMRIAAHYDVAFLARPLVHWRCHPDSRTSQLVFSPAGAKTAHAIREEVLAKRLILTRHLGPAAGTPAFRRSAWRALAAQIVHHAEALLADGRRARAAGFLLRMCSTAPEVTGDAGVLRAMLKCALPAPGLALLRRLRVRRRHPPTGPELRG